MVQDIAKQILFQHGALHSALPSVRQVAAHFRISPLTAHRALQELARDKKIYAISRKGFFWGSAPEPAPPWSVQLPLRRREEIRNAMLRDLKKGTLNPFADLPPQKVLAYRYGCTARTMQAILQELQQRSILSRIGNRWQFKHSQPHPRRNRIILVVRSDCHGKLLLETDRELEFMRSVYREVRSLGFELQVIGWDESSSPPCFRDAFGKECRWIESTHPPYGILLSSWLIHGVQRLIRLLRKKRVPLSVWWEHPVHQAHKSSTQKSRVAYFNLAFGTGPGRIVAEHLLGKGIHKVLFLSPFHGSEWSRNRLEGLRQVLGPQGISIEALVDEKTSSSWEIQMEIWGKLKMSHPGLPFDSPQVHRLRDRALSRTICSLLEPVNWAPAPVALVGVNDQTTALALPFLQEKQSYVVSFDNSSLSIRFQFSSFAFHTDAMVRNMLHHLIQPDSQLFALDAIQEIEGWVEEKSGAFF